MTTEEKIEELEQLNAYYSNILLLGGMEFVYKNFMVTKDDKGRWVLKKYVSSVIDGENENTEVSKKESDTDKETLIDTLEIPHFIQVIGTYAFSPYGTKISKLIIPEGVEIIERWAFYDCKINEISLPTTIKTIGEHAFGSCDITNLYIPDNVETIGKYAFIYNVHMQSLSIPSKVSLDKWAFQCCGRDIKNARIKLTLRKSHWYDRLKLSYLAAFKWSPFKWSALKYLL